MKRDPTDPILVVEDDEDARAQMRETLEDAGYTVVEVPHGKEALHYLTSAQREPGLILLDLAMPEMTGWELLAVLQSYSRLSSIPVIVVSVHNPSRHPAPTGSFILHLQKPVASDALINAVGACFRGA